MCYVFFYKEKPATSKESFGRVMKYYVIAKAGYQLQQSRVISLSKLINFIGQML